MSRRFSRQEFTGTGITWNFLFPDSENFVNKLILRNEYKVEDKEYTFKLLNSLFFNKAFRYTNPYRCVYHISSKVEVILQMINQFDTHEGTDIRKSQSNMSFATYEEDTELDIDNLDINDDIEERVGNRESGQKTEDQSINYSINEIINREKRIHDFITKEIIPLFSARQIDERKENYHGIR